IEIPQQADPHHAAQDMEPAEGEYPPGISDDFVHGFLRSGAEGVNEEHDDNREHEAQSHRLSKRIQWVFHFLSPHVAIRIRGYSSRWAARRQSGVFRERAEFGA